MADALTVENVNVAQIMSVEGAHEKVEQLVAVMEENPAVKKLLEAAQSMEDMYHIAKEYVEMKLEDFKVLWDKMVAYYKEEKAALDDDVMDGVVGGWSISGFFHKWKRVIVASCIMVGCMVTGAAIGAACGGIEGAVLGAYAGAAVGALATGAYWDATNPNKK